MTDPDTPWEELSHQVLAAAIADQRQRAASNLPVWQEPAGLEDALRTGGWSELTSEPRAARELVEFLLTEVLSHPTGNVDPRFLGWVHGSGHELGVISAVIVAAMNANTGGRHHGAMLIESTVRQWLLRIFGFQQAASAVLTQGTSEANLLGLAVAREWARSVRRPDAEETYRPDPRLEVLYTGPGVHESVTKAARILQFGPLRCVGNANSADERLDPEALAVAIANDLDAGLHPVAIVATAGGVDSGATDDLLQLRAVANRFGLWLHVDGAFGAWLRIAPSPFDAPVRGIDGADSLALDLHKWLPVPMTVGALLVRDSILHRRTFSTRAPYLQHGEALAGGEDWPTDYGIALSRPFQGLAPFMILQSIGLRALGEGIAHCVVLADYFSQLLVASGAFRLARPTVGNVVRFEPIPKAAPGYSARRGGGPTGLDAMSRSVVDAGRLAALLQRDGSTVFSTTIVDGRQVLRACFVHHGTRTHHVEEAVQQLLSALKER
jgi:aromatic-L-amino-acid decarboxylase